MPNSPQDQYNPVQTVAPEVSSPNNLLSEQASPTDFGAQVGQATQKLGSSLDTIGNQTSDIVLQQQGLLNEAAATDANTERAKQAGDIYGWYKSLEGPDKVNAYPEAVQKVANLRQSIAKTLNPAAARAFNLMAGRQESYELQDLGTQKAEAIKQTALNSATASLSASVDQLSRPEVAFDDSRSGYELGNLKFQVNNWMQIQGYSSVMKQDPKTGAVTFDDTEQGKQAAAIYQNKSNEVLGKAYETRAITMADDPIHGNVVSAVKMLEDNKDAIPAAAYAKISQELAPRYRNAQVDGIFQNDVVNSIHDSYQSHIATTPPPAPWKGIPYAPTTNNSQLTDAFIDQESGGRGNNLGQIQPSTWAAYAKPGENINNPNDNRAVTSRVIDAYSKLPNVNGDTSRLAVAYFSGPSNVAPLGSATPWVQDKSDKTGKTTSSYVSDITNKVHGNTATSNSPQSLADYVGTHSQEIIQKATDAAEARYPGDSAIQQQVVQKTEQYLNTISSQQAKQDRADQDAVRDYISGAGSDKQPITVEDQLKQAPDDIQKAWKNLQVNNSYAANGVRNLITANASGKATTFGTDFANHYFDVLSGTIKHTADIDNFVQPGLGAHSPLTNTGATLLNKEIQLNSTPQGAAFAHAEQSFLTTMRSQITATGTVPGAQDPKGDTKFNQFLQEAVPMIQSERAKGTPATDLFDPKSSNYVGKLLPHYQRPLAEMIKDRTEAIEQMTPAQIWGIGGAGVHTDSTTKFDIKSLDSVQDGKQGITNLQQAIKNKSITVQQAKDYSTSRGWTVKPPQVPNAAAQ